MPEFAPTKSPMVLLAPVLVTTPEAVESAMVPALVPAKPPSPSTVLLAPELLTAPEAVESAMVPPLAPTKPPMVLLAPELLTAPEAVESAMGAGAGSRPNRRRVLLAPAAADRTPKRAPCYGAALLAPDETADDASSAGAETAPESGRIRDGASVGSDQTADDDVGAGGWETAPGSGRIRDGARR